MTDFSRFDYAPAGKFDYGNPLSIHYGIDSVRHLPSVLADLGAERVHLVTARSLIGSRSLEHVSTQSPALGRATVSLAAAHSPVANILDAGLAARTAGADVIVGLGGGSALDTAKFASLIATSALDENAAPADVARVLRDPEARASIPIIAVPTTLSAAELYGDGGFTDPDTGQKVGARNASLTPKVVFYDPRATEDTPASLWFSTAVRALDHAVETFLAPGVDPVSSAMATSSARALVRVLGRAQGDMGGLEDRLAAQIAAWKSYLNPPLASSGVSHIIGRVLGARNGIPHGVASCVVLPQALQALNRHDVEARRRLDSLAGQIGVDRSEGSPGTQLIHMVGTHIRDCGLPTRFTRNQLGRDAEDEAVVVAAAESGRPLAFVAEVISACVE
ncbi:MAG TPA: iron-containing alcohol dehydrogenase [Pseudolysinimonas sp.]|nr:iron-containing alcohol dehydrogenase [Pseudolysinimonas sp.]